MTTPRFFNCYQDQDPRLSPKSTRLVFKAVIYHGPGHDENQWIRIGVDDTKQWDVLWLRTDWGEGIFPLVWVAKGSLRGRALWTGLVQAWFAGAKAAQDATEPPPTMSSPRQITPCSQKTMSRPSPTKSGPKSRTKTLPSSGSDRF